MLSHIHRLQRVIPHFRSTRNSLYFKHAWTAPYVRWIHLTRMLRAIVPFQLSDIGEGIREVVVKEWYVKVGDSVNQFDPICEVQSDKATVTITSRYDGIVRALHFDLQDTCVVGQALLDFEIEGDAPAPTSESPTELTSSKVDETLSEELVKREDRGSPLATPSVRRLASENKIDLSAVKGTGKDGRILKEDILNFLNKSSPPPSPAKETPRRSVAAPSIVPAKDDKVVPLTVIQRSMKATMMISNQIPHFVVCDELDLSQLVQLRAETGKWLMERYGMKITYLPFFLKAASLALFEFPGLNAITDETCDNITLKASHNIGVAMDTPDGLIVPNIKAVEQLSVIQIAAELKRLQELGAEGKLGPSDLIGGTITLSNIGSIGGTYTAPRILPPQVMIGGLGRIQRLPRFAEDGSIRDSHILTVSWAADHRVIDGATVARFSKAWRNYLEKPTSLVFELK